MMVTERVNDDLWWPRLVENGARVVDVWISFRDACYGRRGIDSDQVGVPSVLGYSAKKNVFHIICEFQNAALLARQTQQRNQKPEGFASEVGMQ